MPQVSSYTLQQALRLAAVDDTAALMSEAARLRDSAKGNVVSYSRKVFIPLTRLCRDVCHYCTFAQTPKHTASPYMSVEDVLTLARHGAEQGCKEALFTLGEKPELRYRVARQALETMGFDSTLEYVAHVAGCVLRETGLLPHINAGCMNDDEIALLRPVSASMGLMLETTSERLSEKGMPHYGSPDKAPALRLATIARAGRACVPFTSGILIGIGETRRERIESLLALRDLHREYGHLQEIIVQNFRAKPGTVMHAAPEPDLDELLWSIAVARLIFGAEMNLQAPPNLSPGGLEQVIAAGINDWGGVSPVTPDFVNPEAPWPHVRKLAAQTAQAGKYLQERLTIYPAYATRPEKWLHSAVCEKMLRNMDSEGFARTDNWVPGGDTPPPASEVNRIAAVVNSNAIAADLLAIVAKVKRGESLCENEVVRLFRARGDEFSFVCQTADQLRRQANGDTVTYVVNRNINYTNVCYFKCRFCAFSKGRSSDHLRGRPYDLSGEEIRRRVVEAWQRGATEVCMQGGIHPDYTGQTYLDICRNVKAAVPEMHIHAFSPLEIWQGARTLDIDIEAFLRQLRSAGLSTLPGTAAEVLDDEVRAVICPDKIDTGQWLQVMEAAHCVGLRSTATIMFGHVERIEHWARHLLRIRDLQQRTGGFTEFVPLPFVPMEAPLYRKGKARRGPTFREAILMHAVARIVLHDQIPNIQASWVKLGEQGVIASLRAGVNDLGGTLMNESITRAAGAIHGEEMPPREMEARINAAARCARQRTTLYGDAPKQRVVAACNADALVPLVNTPAEKHSRPLGLT